MTYTNTAIKDFADFMEPTPPQPEPYKPPAIKPSVFRVVSEVDNSDREFEQFLEREINRIERRVYVPIRYLEAVG